jgi:hypothetical protein
VGSGGLTPCFHTLVTKWRWVDVEIGVGPRTGLNVVKKRKIPCHVVDLTPVVQPVASHCTELYSIRLLTVSPCKSAVRPYSLVHIIAICSLFARFILILSSHLPLGPLAWCFAVTLHTFLFRSIFDIIESYKLRSSSLRNFLCPSATSSFMGSNLLKYRQFLLLLRDAKLTEIAPRLYFL